MEKDKWTSSSWQSLEQNLSDRATKEKWNSLRFWKIHFFRLVAFGSILLIFLLLLLGFFYRTSSWIKIFKFQKNLQHLQKIQFQSDGKLNAKWCQRFLGISQHTDLLSLDLIELKKRLEKVSQILEVYIEKRFPDTLFIKLKEHKPLLRIRLSNSSSEAWFLSTEGHIFRALQGEERWKSLPFFKQDSIQRTSTGFKPIKGIKILKEFLEVAQKHNPKLYRRFRQIAISALEDNTPKPWSYIEVVLDKKEQIFFGPYDFIQQLDRLDFLLNQIQGRRLRVERIQLTVANQAIIQLPKTLPSR